MAPEYLTEGVCLYRIYFKVRKIETYATVKALCIPKGKDWVTAQVPRLSLRISCDCQPLPSCLGVTVLGLHIIPLYMLGI